MSEHDAVDHPAHYTSDPSGVECITITRHRSFNIGNAIKYLWRAGLKRDADRDELAKQIEDLEKARWYIADEIALLDPSRTPARLERIADEIARHGFTDEIGVCECGSGYPFGMARHIGVEVLRVAGS